MEGEHGGNQETVFRVTRREDNERIQERSGNVKSIETPQTPREIFWRVHSTSSPLHYHRVYSKVLFAHIK
jgi:hypothetical protein